MKKKKTTKKIRLGMQNFSFLESLLVPTYELGRRKLTDFSETKETRRRCYALEFKTKMRKKKDENKEE